MIGARSFTVSPGEEGQRLDAVLRARYASSSTSLVQHAIADGRVTVNGHAAPKGHKLRAGDDVQLARLAETSDQRVAPNPGLPLEILFADDDVVAANKQDQEDAWEAEDLRIALKVDSSVKLLPCVARDKESVKNVLLELLYAILERTEEEE